MPEMGYPQRQTCTADATVSLSSAALRYQHATLERDQAIAERLGELLRAADAAEPGVAVVNLGR
jgi:hypothetical protein